MKTKNRGTCEHEVIVVDAQSCLKWHECQMTRKPCEKRSCERFARECKANEEGLKKLAKMMTRLCK